MTDAIFDKEYVELLKKTDFVKEDGEDYYRMLLPFILSSSFPKKKNLQSYANEFLEHVVNKLGEFSKKHQVGIGINPHAGFAESFKLIVDAFYAGDLKFINHTTGDTITSSVVDVSFRIYLFEMPDSYRDCLISISVAPYLPGADRNPWVFGIGFDQTDAEIQLSRTKLALESSTTIPNISQFI